MKLTKLSELDPIDPINRDPMVQHFDCEEEYGVIIGNKAFDRGGHWKNIS